MSRRSFMSYGIPCTRVNLHRRRAENAQSQNWRQTRRWLRKKNVSCSSWMSVYRQQPKVPVEPSRLKLTGKRVVLRLNRAFHGSKHWRASRSSRKKSRKRRRLQLPRSRLGANSRSRSRGNEGGSRRRERGKNNSAEKRISASRLPQGPHSNSSSRHNSRFSSKRRIHHKLPLTSTLTPNQMASYTILILFIFSGRAHSLKTPLR